MCDLGCRLANPGRWFFRVSLVFSATLLAAESSHAVDLYVAMNGNDANACTQAASPCRTITRGISRMASGDTLIVGDGTYTESITDMPSGTAGAYTTIRAANDWGVLIDGSNFPDSFNDGIEIENKSYVVIRGFRVHMNQANQSNGGVVMFASHHIKIQRCGVGYVATAGNSSTIALGPDVSYALIEECYAFGGARYQIQVHQSDHVVVRRSVVRNDHWTGSLQCAGFTNYDATNTVWQNNIALDSDTQYCAGRLFGAFWNENKEGAVPDTSEVFQGNIVLNVQAFAGATLNDSKVSGTHTYIDNVVWGSVGGLVAGPGPGVPATVNATRMTLGGLTGTYDGANGRHAAGSGFAVFAALPNALSNSLLVSCNSFGVTDYAGSNFNAFWDNGANYGGEVDPVPGSNDLSVENGSEIDVMQNGLRYLPRIEAGSPLKTAGENGGQIGAQIMFKVGRSGSLYGEPGWSEVTTEPLWPFPNEAVIRADMAAYNGPGAPGVRGFTSGNSLDGTPQTLTKYIWEYLGNQIPDEIYGEDIFTDGFENGSKDAA